MSKHEHLELKAGREAKVCRSAHRYSSVCAYGKCGQSRMGELKLSERVGSSDASYPVQLYGHSLQHAVAPEIPEGMDGAAVPDCGGKPHTFFSLTEIILKHERTQQQTNEDH